MNGEQYPKVYLYKRIVQAKLFIDDNFTRHIELDKIADEAYFSKFHFLRVFREAYGRTPHQYLVYKRMERAKELLKNGTSVTEACFMVGFESLGSFSTLFKRNTGYSPSDYQSIQEQLKTDMLRKPLAFVPGCFAAANGWR